MSLVSGLSFGGLLAYGAFQMSQNPKNFIFSLGERSGCYFDNNIIIIVN